ncbi:MAG: efflux RND transporter periplasmic adaptor subunit [Chthonomonas sp.]|nr:efflux RND transporter periplasmic adaptor subunit [Chthonomonas sp.]
MKRTLLLTSLLLAATMARAGEEDHAHGPDGRHLPPTQTTSNPESQLLSHHDLRIEGADGKSMLGCTVESKIWRKDKPSEIVHTEANAYEAENEVYGSHMTYRAPGEYVISEGITFPDGRKTTVEFPIIVAAEQAAAAEDEHAHGPNYLAIVGGILGVGAALVIAFRMGKRSGRGPMVAMLLLSGVLVTGPRAQESEAAHAHGPDGRHIIPMASKGSVGPKLPAYVGQAGSESQTKTVEGVKFTLTIENEETVPDPDVVQLSEQEVRLTGLKTAQVQVSPAAGGMYATGRVQANPNGRVIVNSRTGGRVLTLSALPGTEVRKGQVLAVLESTELADAQASMSAAIADQRQVAAAVQSARSAIAAAESRVATAERTLARQRQFAKAGEFSSPTLEAAKAEASRVAAELSSARTRLMATEATVGRLARGVASGVVAQRELDAARAEVALANTALGNAHRQDAVAKAALAREQGIAKQGLRDAKEVEQAAADLSQARAELTSRRSDLTRAIADQARAATALRISGDQVRLLGGRPGGGHRISITAPISGEVESRSVSLGETIASGQQLFELLNASVVWVICDIYEKDIRRVQIGQHVDVVADALPGLTFPGEIAFVHNEVEEKTRTTKVRVAINNPGERLKQNMFVRAQIGIESGRQVTVPTSAVQIVKGMSMVFLKQGEGVFRKHIVQVQSTLGDKTILRTELPPASVVVTDGSYQLAAIAGSR